MKVIELINLLKEFPDDYEVAVNAVEQGMYFQEDEEGEDGFDVYDLEEDRLVIIDLGGTLA